MSEMVVALGLLAFTMLPLSVAFVREHATAQALYRRAVAMAIVDGEIETLAAGEWRRFPPGTHAYTVSAVAATNLPAGRFQLTLEGRRVRLEWRPALRNGGGSVRREFELPPDAVEPSSTATGTRAPDGTAPPVP